MQLVNSTILFQDLLLHRNIRRDTLTAQLPTNTCLGLGENFAGALVVVETSIQVMNLFVVFKNEWIASKILLLVPSSRELSP